MSESTAQQYVFVCGCGELVCQLCLKDHHSHPPTQTDRVMHLRDKHKEEFKNDIKMEESSGGRWKEGVK